MKQAATGGQRPRPGTDSSSYFLILYARSPASFFSDSIFNPRFFPAVERNPRTLCACQSVALMISARVAPLGRPISSRILAPLPSARGVFSAAFFVPLADFLAAGLAALAPFLALAASCLGLAPFFEAALVGATGAPCAATAAGPLLVASAFVMMFSFR